MPTRSRSPKIPVFGHPKLRLMTASAISTEIPRDSASAIAWSIQAQPRRFAMNPGLSLLRITTFPRALSAKFETCRTAVERVSGPATISRSLR